MTTQDFIMTLCCPGDDQRMAGPKRSDAQRSPREVGTLALGCALQGVGNRAFSRWLTRDSQAWLPWLPTRPRVFRLVTTPTQWTARFLAAPTVLGVADSDGSERVPPLRAGRWPPQRGQTGTSHPRGLVGGTRCFLVHPWGGSCAWGCATAHGYDAHFHPLSAQVVGRRIVLTETGCHAKTGHPANLKICPRGPWHVRMLVETLLSMLTTVFQTKQLHHRVWDYCCARLAWTMAAFNILAPWGMAIADNDMVRLSIAEFSL